MLSTLITLAIAIQCFPLAASFCVKNEYDKEIWIWRNHPDRASFKAGIKPGAEQCCHWSNKDCTNGTAEGDVDFLISLRNMDFQTATALKACGGCSMLAQKDEYNRPVFDVWLPNGTHEGRWLFISLEDIEKIVSDQTALERGGPKRVSGEIECPCGAQICTKQCLGSYASTVTYSAGGGINIASFVTATAGFSPGTTKTWTASEVYEIPGGSSGYVTFHPKMRYISGWATKAFQPDNITWFEISVPQTLPNGMLDGTDSFFFTKRGNCPDKLPEVVGQNNTMESNASGDALIPNTATIILAMAFTEMKDWRKAGDGQPFPDNLNSAWSSNSTENGTFPGELLNAMRNNNLENEPAGDSWLVAVVATLSGVVLLVAVAATAFSCRQRRCGLRRQEAVESESGPFATAANGQPARYDQEST